MRNLLTVGVVSLAMALPMAAQAKKGKQLKNFVSASYVQPEYEEDFNGFDLESDEGTGFRVDAQYFISNSIAVIGRYDSSDYELNDTNGDLKQTRMEIGARAYMPLGQSSNLFIGTTYNSLDNEFDAVDEEYTIISAQLGASGVVATDVKVWGIAKIGTAVNAKNSDGADTTEFEVGVSYRFYQQYAAHVFYNKLESTIESDNLTFEATQEFSSIGAGISYLF